MWEARADGLDGLSQCRAISGCTVTKCPPRKRWPSLRLEALINSPSFPVWLQVSKSEGNPGKHRKWASNELLQLCTTFSLTCPSILFYSVTLRAGKTTQTETTSIISGIEGSAVSGADEVTTRSQRTTRWCIQSRNLNKSLRSCEGVAYCGSFVKKKSQKRPFCVRKQSIFEHKTNSMVILQS